MPGNNDRKYSNCWRERERKRIQTAKRNGWTGIYVPATTKTIRRCVFNTTDGNIHPQIGPQQKNMKEYGRAIPRWRQSVSVRPGTFLLKLFRNARLACFWAVGVILTRHRSPVPNWYLPSIDHALDALALLFFPPTLIRARSSGDHQLRHHDAQLSQQQTPPRCCVCVTGKFRPAIIRRAKRQSLEMEKKKTFGSNLDVLFIITRWWRMADCRRSYRS